MAAKDDLGRRGERIASDHLVAIGYDVIERNWRCREGELDIVARIGGQLVFVEVKTRSSVAYGHPFEAITPQKLARLRRLATLWCQAHPTARQNIRVDVIGIIAPTHGLVEIEHLEGVG